MLNITTITPPRVPLTDPRTGMISREWYRFFLNLFVLTGSGSNAVTLEDLQKAPADMSLAAFSELGNLFNQVLSAPPFDSQIASIETRVRNLADEVNSQPRPELGTMAAVQQDNVRFIGFDTLPSPSVVPAPGVLYWNGGYTLNLGMTNSVTQPIGESQYYYIKATAAITRGQVIMFDGAVGASGVLKAKPAQSVSIADYIMGVAAEDIAFNDFGLITSFGLVDKINTASFSEGAVLYYDPTSVGGFTATPPNQSATAPATSVIVAAVVNSNAGNGSVFVRVSLGSKLGASDSNVQITSLADKNLLQYDSASGYWKNVAPSAIGTVSSISFGTTGLTPSTATTGAVTVAGTLVAANGGTGQNSYTIGDLLYASGATTLSKLADVATGNALISGGVGVAPFWGKIDLTTHVTGILPVANGGTGLNSLTSGYVYFANSSSTFSISPIYSDGTSVGIQNTNMSSFSSTGNQLVIGDGLGSKGFTVYSGATSNANIYFAKGTTGTDFFRGYFQYRHATDVLVLGVGAEQAATFAYSSPNSTLTLGLVGTAKGNLALAGNASGTITISPQSAAGTYNFNLPTSAGSSGQPLLSGGGGATAMSFGTLTVGGGGTGATTLTANGVLIGNGTSAINATTAGTSGQLLQSSGAGVDPTWTTATYPTTTTINQLLYSSSANTVAGLATANTSALVTNSSGVPSWASGSTANRVLRTDGTTVSFAQVALSTDISGFGANVATFLATPTSANLAAAVTDETGSGALVFATTPSFASTVGVGAATAAASGAGVTFPSAQSASSDANTLDDYEEGTFLPTIEGTTSAGTGTYAANGQVGIYTKIGNTVIFNIYVSWTNHTGTGNLRLANLPFASSSATNSFRAVSIWSNTLALTAGNVLQCYVTSGTAIITIQQTPTGTTAAAAVPMDTAAAIMFSGTYTV